MSDFNTPLKKARNLGAAKDGTKNYKMQRFTAILLIPLSFWFVYFIMQLANDSFMRATYIASSLNFIAAILFILMFLYHGMIGMKIIIEDYVHGKIIKSISLFLLQAVCLISAVAGIYAIFSIHFVVKFLGA